MRGYTQTHRIRFHEALYVLYMLCYVSNLACAAAEVSDKTEVWNKTQLLELYNKGVFRLESISQKLCLSADTSGLSLTSCDPPSATLLWKWVSRHRLYNLGTKRCLGINATKLLQPDVGVFECDVSLPTMWWRCGSSMLYSAMNNKLTVVDSKVVVRKTTSVHQWRIYGAAGEGPCAYPYEDIHTLQGNSRGMTCSIPFKYNNKWFWDCTSEGREDRHLWCATTNRYDQDEKWGFCPNPVSDCNEFWESHPELNACYQFNLYSILTWSQALTSCQAQGGSLLSITQSSEQSYIIGRLLDMGVMVWIGLNHLSQHGGWQWSDGSPLALVSYTADLTSTPVQENQQCGVFNSTLGSWQSLSCESALPYICKKTTKHNRNAEPLDDWQYKETICPDGWLDHNAFCYRCVEEKLSWDSSSSACKALEAELVSIHSLSQQELLLKLLSNGSNSKVWIGLHKEAKLSTVQWSDGSPVTFTSWYSQEPSHCHGDKQICVTADWKEGRWQFEDCEEQHAAICKARGLVPQHPTGEWDEGCSEGWRRKDNWCYKITDQEQTFEDAVKGYYCRSPLVTVESRFEQTFLNSLISEMGGSQYRFYWTALQDQNRTGEYRWLTQNGSSATLTYTNWNRHQPVIGGGCVVMSGGQALGHWEVKNCHTFKALAVCKQEVSGNHDTLMPVPHIDMNAQCPTGWESRKGLSHCYKVYHSEKILMHRTWTEAQFFCRALGADLASFHHYEDQTFVKKLLSMMFQSTEGRWFWVGFTKRNPWSDGAWEWSDGTPVVTSFIEDMNELDSRMCAVYSDLTNTLTPHSCDSKYEWICKVPRGVELVKPYWYSDQQEPWVFFRGAEYYFASKPFPWGSVSFACKMMGADLLSVHSREELDFIREHMIKVSEYWWIGLSANSGHNGLSWTDGSALDYENWENGRFYRKPGQNCIQMSSQSGQWSAGSCKDRHGYVCKRRTVSLVEDPREPHYVGRCPENWFYYGHKCLFLHLPTHPEDGKTWQDAQSICSSYQGSLVSIEDEIEQAYIVMLLNGWSAGLWIGARGRFSSKWSNGKPLSYNNWEMSNYRSPEEPHCTYLSNSHNFRVTGLWQDDVCTESVYGFVCQKPQDITKRPTQSYYTASSLDSSEYKNHSYRIIHGNLSWYQAQKTCLEKGAALVSITDPFQQAYLTVLISRLEAPHWIGLYSTDDGISHQWSDGSEISFTYWEVSNYYPEGPMGDGGCMSMDVNGRWKDVECDMLLSGAICYMPPPKSIAFSYEVVCPETWVKFRGSCYYFETVILKMTLEEARNHCKKKGNFSDVLTVQDDEESRFFLKEMSPHYRGPQNLWLGILYDTDTDALTRLDGSPLHYTNWRSKAPDASDMRADSCVTMQVSDAVWQLADCTEKLGFICKTSTGAIKEVELEPLKGLHQGVISAAALVAIALFAVVIGSLWLLYKRNSLCILRLPTFGSAYYRQTSFQGNDQDENVLLPDLEPQAGD
ncbi:secretory phospholipase A2 receptor-like [Sinocyclocheilus anshuiensis]|uniref:secretory phospholipase A2 receptor-like n=1 Tax=Sinocyclocheilus anshuiensis TaxID=1608454 RepID=UPI0007B80FF9|nr:PREDICTED: secretory phospholipase A2 receptor-like [Sinocyclocheilus anshuiensis]